jgi:RNA-directed DNA polymerase
MYRELLKLGAPAKVARLVAANSRRWWRNSAQALNSVLTIAYFDRLGMPRLT